MNLDIVLLSSLLQLHALLLSFSDFASITRPSGTLIDAWWTSFTICMLYSLLAYSGWFRQNGSSYRWGKFLPATCRVTTVSPWLISDYNTFVSFFGSTDILEVTSSMLSFSLVPWYRNPGSEVVMPALQALGEIASGANDAQTQVKIKMCYYLMILGTSKHIVIKVVEHVTLVSNESYIDYWESIILLSRSSFMAF